MSEDTGIIKAGMAIVFSYGSYSNYTFGQVYIAARDFNYIKEAEVFYKDERIKEPLDQCFVEYDLYPKFESYLIQKGFLVLCENREIHMGDYDFFNSGAWEDELRKEARFKGEKDG